MRRGTSRFVAGIGAAAAVFLVAGVARPQGFASSPDLSAVTAQAQTAQTQSAQALAAVQALQTAMPQPCLAVPAPDTLLGSVGSGSCYTRSTDTRPTAVQSAPVVTDGNGMWSVTWKKPFSGASYGVIPVPSSQSGTPSQPISCMPDATTQTATFVRGFCFRGTPMVLPALTSLNIVGSLNGLGLNPNAPVAAGIPVAIFGREFTQQ